MIQVSYPEPAFKIKKENGKNLLFDPIRKIWVVLTDEEWVRQNFVQYLVTTLKYPSALIAIEKEITLNQLKKRFDILVYSSEHQPWMLVECKAPQVKLDDAVLEQVLRYNISVPVPYMVITNGVNTVAWHKQSGELRQLHQMPLVAEE
ncbi:MAG TPA: type I restriction enzyme HsdR N-terminal domain-containing protein [Chitinophagaceae bacterium]|nr:type I restriction enzyme HsdR N-terminal domain-containing protein [Chitinophagaceae bacterium]